MKFPQPPSYAQNLYDAIMFYAVTVNDTLAQGQDYRNGTTIRMNMGNKVFASRSFLYLTYRVMFVLINIFLSAGLYNINSPVYFT